MSTTEEYVQYVCGQIMGAGELRYRKMFGEYMVYVDEKPVLLVCDNTVFVKKLPGISKKMEGAATGTPYQGAKEHYILDIDDGEMSRALAAELAAITPLPKPKKKKI